MKKTHRYKQASGHQWKRDGRGEYRSRGLRRIILGHTVRYKINYRDILYNIGNIANVL